MTFDDDYLQVENVLYDYCECLMLTNAVFNWPSAKEAESRDSPTVRLRISEYTDLMVKSWREIGL